MRITEMITKDKMFCDVRTNSLKQYHKGFMKNSVEEMHFYAAEISFMWCPSREGSRKN